ncbi:MAG: helix-hairpin-helix domain-containing protein [Actinomycetota bacterium]
MDDWRPIAHVEELEQMPRRQPRQLATWIDHGRRLVHWFGAARIFTTLVTVPLIGFGVFALLRPEPSPVEADIRYASTVPTSDQGSIIDANREGKVTVEAGTSAGIVVHVAGHVYSPGVYTLTVTGRIVDAIRAAGGAQPIADLNAINLALRLSDGDQIYVPAVGEVVRSSTAGRIGVESDDERSVFPIDINSATASVLEELPGIGPSTAAAIIAHRENVGRFASTSGLLDVPGIGTSKFEAIKDLVRV